MIEVDDKGLRALAADIEAMGPRIVKDVPQVVAKAAVNTKAAMKKDMAGSRHFHQVAKSISYDLVSTPDFAEAEIGPETGGQTVGDLAHFAYFGGARGGGATVRDPQEAANDEAPAYEKALTELLDRSLP